MTTHLVQTDNVYSVFVTVIANGELSFSPDPVVIQKKNALVTFNLVTPGYVFPFDGTALTISDGDDEFPIAWYINPVMIGLADYNNDVDDYAYTMTVQNIQTGQRISKDPSISNDNER